MEKCALLGDIYVTTKKSMSSYHGALCHDMSYVTTIVASLETTVCGDVLTIGDGSLTDSSTLIS